MGFNLVPFLKFIRIEHTIFDLPFAYAGVIMAGVFTPRVFFLISLAAVSARVSGMSINRITDLPADKENPRTRKRQLVTGEISLRGAYVITITSSLSFILFAFLLNAMAGILSPLIILLFYTYPRTKKYPGISHIIIGLSIGLIVLAGYVGATGTFPLFFAPYLLTLFVTLWIAGFDILYQNQDREFDRRLGVKSIPVLLNGNILFPTLVFYVTSAAVLVSFSIKSEILAILSLPAILLLFLRFADLKRPVDSIFLRFDVPIPFLILLGLVLSRIIHI